MRRCFMLGLAFVFVGCTGEEGSSDVVPLVDDGKADTAQLATLEAPYDEPAIFSFECENAAGCDIELSACLRPETRAAMPAGVCAAPIADLRVSFPTADGAVEALSCGSPADPCDTFTYREQPMGTYHAHVSVPVVVAQSLVAQLGGAPVLFSLDVSVRGAAGDEVCDNLIDDDRDGTIDEGCPCAGARERPCYPGPEATRDVGECRSGMQYCDPDGWSECIAPWLPIVEVCDDGLDNDCNRLIDEQPCQPLTGSACSLIASCDECTDTAGCGFCDVGGCMAGNASGADDGACPSGWSFEECPGE